MEIGNSGQSARFFRPRFSERGVEFCSEYFADQEANNMATPPATALYHGDPYGAVDRRLDRFIVVYNGTEISTPRVRGGVCVLDGTLCV